jgi:hypothetical protein
MTIKILKLIANRIGGLLQENDCGNAAEESLQPYCGRLTDSDGLQYFLKYSVLENKDGLSIKQLNKTILDWKEDISDMNRPAAYELYKEDDLYDPSDD